MDCKQKILFCGDVEGKFNAFFNRIENLNKKSGPFDLVLCVGNFFGINNREFDAYKIGEKKVSVPIYILGPNKGEHISLYPDDEFELCPNVYCLGKRGLYISSGGLKIAYLSGIYSEDSENLSNYSKKDVEELYSACARGNPNFRGVDILLTSQWPTGITTNPIQNATCDLLSWLTIKIRPRYFICGLEGMHYERPPFRCPIASDQRGELEIVTRFIALARVGNPKKEKWLYALSLTPLDKMRITDLLQKTTDETPCPFNLEELENKIFKIKRKASTTQYFYDTSSEPQEFAGKRPKRERPTFDQSKCWFCLASPTVEKHLVVSVGDHAYLALVKGGLVDEHMLICPIEHHQCTIGQPTDVTNEIQKYKEAVNKFYARNGEVAVFFERNYKTLHMQLQCIPLPKQATREIKEIFKDEAQAHGFELHELESHSRLDQVIPAGAPYFYVDLPDGTTLYTKISHSMNFPINFGREVLATGAILNMPEKTDWRECTMTREDEEKLVQRIRSDFEPYDFTM